MKRKYIYDSEGYVLLDFPQPTPDFVMCLRRGYFGTKIIFGQEYNVTRPFYARISKIQRRKIGLWKIYLSDGSKVICVYLASQAVAKIKRYGISKGDLVYIQNYAITYNNEKQVIIVCELNIA